MTKYEYRTITNSVSYDSFMGILNDLGQQGWRAVHFEWTRDGLDIYHRSAILERAVEEVEVTHQPERCHLCGVQLGPNDPAAVELATGHTYCMPCAQASGLVGEYMTETTEVYDLKPVVDMVIDRLKAKLGQDFPNGEPVPVQPESEPHRHVFKCSKCGMFIDTLNSFDGNLYCGRCLPPESARKPEPIVCAECGAIPANTQRPDTGDWFCEKCWPHQEEEAEAVDDTRCDRCHQDPGVISMHDGQHFCIFCYGHWMKEQGR